MRVAAVADLHAPTNLNLFKEALLKLGGCDLFLLAGDIVLKGDHTQLPGVVAAIREVYNEQVLACFGNEEYEQEVGKLKEFREITWLDDQAVTVEVGGLKVGVVGTRGSLDRPTFWQRANIRGIWETYRKRVETIDRLLGELQTDVKIVVSHYSPTYLTLEGERETAMPEMASQKMEDVIKKRQPDVWFHGHIHKGKKLDVEIGRTLVVNSSLPARGKIAVAELPKRTGIEKFIG
ncbi:MAG: metallophosphoesterase [Candidatus Hadarchaeota archaeon]